ncbi:hypothetical protein ACHAPT_004624 [Fusarium lateritium]
MNMNSLLRGPPPGPASMAQQQQFHETMVREIIQQEIQEEILQEQRLEIAALATLLLSRRDEDDASDYSYETSYEYYSDPDEDEDDDPSSLEQPPVAGRKRSLPRTETQPPVPQKRPRIDPKPAAQPQPQPQKTEQPSTPKEAKDCEIPVGVKADNSHRHAVIQAALNGSAFEYCRPVAQIFLGELDCDKLGALDVAKAVYDMGIRFSKVASDDEFNIAFYLILANPRDAVLYNIGQRTEKHKIFWGRVSRITHRATPPLDKPDKEELELERKAKEEKSQPKPATTRRAPAPRPVAREKLEPKSNFRRLFPPNLLPPPVKEKKPRGNLKASLIKQVDEKTKIPLNERVRKWLDDVVPMESKAE